MKIRYRGIVNPTSRRIGGGCSSCGGKRLGKTKMEFLNNYVAFFEGREYSFFLGKEYEVSDEAGVFFLKKFSLRNGMKVMAFEEVVK